MVRCRESEIIGAMSKTREPRGYPRGNVIGSWARGGPFGGVFWVCAMGRQRTKGNAGGERLAVSRFESGASACRRAAALSRPKARPPKPRGAYFTNDRAPHSTPLSQQTRIHIRTDTRVSTSAPLVATVREKKRLFLREGSLS